MLRVKVYEVDENGAEKPYLDDEGNPLVREGAGLVMAMQTAEIVGDVIESIGNVTIIGKINELAMGTLLNDYKAIEKFMTIARLQKTINEMMHEDEEETEE